MRAATDRRFYAGTRAIGRFGMRVFAPQTMPAPHWHGHVEANLITGAVMTYEAGGAEVVVPPGRLALFWAGAPHRLVGVEPTGEGPPRLANLYLPLDVFLLMPHVAPFQVALLSGAWALLDEGLVGAADMERWYRDYRSGVAVRREILVQELDAALRRALLAGPAWLRPPTGPARGARGGGAPGGMTHVVAMLRHVMENLAEPLPNRAIAAVTGLHEAHATALFTAGLGVPPHRFVVRMRLLRARAILADPRVPVATAAAEAGFASVSQFYHHYRRAYGEPPRRVAQ